MFFWRDSEFCPQEKCKIKIQNIVSGIIPFFYFSGYGKFFNITPRHPPRTFPLGLRVPSLGGVHFACERLKYRGNEPFEICPHFLGRGSFLSPGRAFRLLSESALAIPTLRFSILCLVCRFRFETPDCNITRHSSFSRGHPSRNVRRRMPKCKCTWLPPVRAQNRREEKRRRRAPLFINHLSAQQLLLRLILPYP